MKAETPEAYEKRRDVRVKRTLFVQCRRRGSDEVWASVVIQDISKTGMSFFTGKEFKAGEMIEVKLTTFFTESPISVVGRVVGLEGKPPSKRRLVRTCITHISEKDKIALGKHVQVFLEEVQKCQRKEAKE